MVSVLFFRCPLPPEKNFCGRPGYKVYTGRIKNDKCNSGYKEKIINKKCKRKS
jgi:hypothetical protein